MHSPDACHKTGVHARTHVRIMRIFGVRSLLGKCERGFMVGEIKVAFRRVNDITYARTRLLTSLFSEVRAQLSTH